MAQPPPYSQPGYPPPQAGNPPAYSGKIFVHCYIKLVSYSEYRRNEIKGESGTVIIKLLSTSYAFSMTVNCPSF